MRRKRTACPRLVLALGAIAAMVTAAPATGAEEGFPVPTKLPGLYAAGVAFFVASPTRGATPEEFVIRHGNPETLVWVRGTLPTLDAHVLVANTGALKVASVKVRVSIYLGETAISRIPGEEEIFPGADRISETLFFERTYEISDILRGAIRRVTVPNIQITEAIRNLARQELWPAYLRVEANLGEVPDDIKVIWPTTSGFLKIVPDR